MVGRVMNLVYKEVRGLHQAAYVLGVFAFGSQILALVRDRLLAHQFGAGLELDIYYAAFRIPDLLYVLFASTLSVYVLVPFVAERMRNENDAEARALLSQMFTLFLAVYTVLAAVVFMAVPLLVPFLFPGLAEEADTLIVLMRILLLQPFFLGLSSLFGVVTQLSHRFVLYALSPLLYNAGIIVGIAFFYPYFGLSGLAVGVVLGALAHFLVQVPLVQGSALYFTVTRRIDWVTIKSVLLISLPRAATLSLHQVELLVLVSIASVMTVGSVAVFQLAYNLQSVPLAIIGASYSTAAFPLLADLFAQKRMEDFRVHLETALRHIIFWSVPVIGLVVVLRAQLVRVVLGSGAFDWSDTRLTAAVLALLAVSLVAQSANLLLIRAFYASGVTRTPFFVTLFGSILSISLIVLLYVLRIESPEKFRAIEDLMRVGGVSGSEVLVIAIGFSIGIIIQTSVLIFLSVRHFSLAVAWIVPHFTRALIAAFFGAVAAYITINFIVEGLNTETFIGIFLQGLFGGLTGLIGVVGAYWLVKSPELNEIYRSFHKRVFKTRIVASQDDVI